MKKKLWMSWSSGKDSAYALWTLQRTPSADVVGLLTTLNEDRGRVAMHATRQSLLNRQAEALGIPVIAIDLPENCPNEIYEARMQGALDRANDAKIDHIAFGDLFLEDIRAYRESMLAGQRITPLFPIWGIPTDVLAARMIDNGFQAYITCIDPKKLPASFAGRRYDQAFLDDLPDGVGPCGENGEFHTFVFDGPNFSEPIDCRVGDTVERDGFVFADVVPA